MNSYKIPSITVDAVIIDKEKNFILIKRKNNPYKNYWALPGGFVEYGETVENAVIRESKEETSIDIKIIDLLGVYSEPDRDPRGHTISVVFIAEGNLKTMKASSDASEIEIFNEKKIENIDLAFDHYQIIKDALKHLLNLN